MLLKQIMYVSLHQILPIFFVYWLFLRPPCLWLESLEHYFLKFIFWVDCFRVIILPHSHFPQELFLTTLERFFSLAGSTAYQFICELKGRQPFSCDRISCDWAPHYNIINILICTIDCVSKNAMFVRAKLLQSLILSFCDLWRWDAGLVYVVTPRYKCG